MKVLILDGAHAGDVMSDRIAAVLEACLTDTERVVLREQKIGRCAGDFFCWVRDPGRCHTDDDNRVVSAKVMRSDLVVLLTPVTFGGYSSALKRMVDHLIQNVQPFFAQIGGETHHRRRYQRYPKMLVVGWLPRPDARAEAIFGQLAHRNAENMYAGTCVSDVLVGEPSDAELSARCRAWLTALAEHASTPVSPLPEIGPVVPATVEPVRRAVLLVGSPRNRNSTSHSLGSYLMSGMASAGVATEIIPYTSMLSAARRSAAMDTVDGADLLVLAFPLYVDSLPGTVTAMFEQLAARKWTGDSPRGFAAIVNCGFPEAAHTATALAICAEFAGAAGFAWRGGLAMGEGEAVQGAGLEALGRRTAGPRRALDLAAEQLAAGRPVPGEAVERLAKPAIPPALYRMIGGQRWRRLGRHYVAGSLTRRPYETVA